MFSRSAAMGTARVRRYADFAVHFTGSPHLAGYRERAAAPTSTVRRQRKGNCPVLRAVRSQAQDLRLLSRRLLVGEVAAVAEVGRFAHHERGGGRSSSRTVTRARLETDRPLLNFGHAAADGTNAV